MSMDADESRCVQVHSDPTAKGVPVSVASLMLAGKMDDHGTPGLHTH